MHINLLRKKFLKIQEKRKQKYAINFLNKLLETRYVYHFDWFGVPTIQFPSDLMVIQDLIFKSKPDIIIETGVAHGGSLIFYSSLLSLLKVKNFKVIGIDIKIKKENRNRILNSKVSKNIELIETSSVNRETFNKLRLKTKNKRVLVILDSDHSASHVFEELEMLSQLIKKNNYIIVMDTSIEFINQKFINKGRKFRKGNSPYTAVKKFIKKNKNFKIDKSYENKSFISSCYSGFLKRIT